MKKIFNKTYTPLQIVINGSVNLLGPRQTIIVEETNSQIENLLKKSLITIKEVR